MKYIFILLLIFISAAHAATLDRFDEVKVYKSRHRMDMLFQGKVVKSYRVMLGKGGRGPKLQKGDSLVPEGRYMLDETNPYSKFYKSIRINYPSKADIERAEKAGVDPGGDIFLHGLPNELIKVSAWLKRNRLERFGEKIIRKLMIFFDWTAGCVAVKDRDMEEIFNRFEGPTPITIYH